MATHPNAEVVREGWKAFVERDFDALADQLDKDVVWHVPVGPMAGTFEGRDAVVEEFFRPQAPLPVTLDSHDTLANDEHVVTLGEVVFGTGDDKQRFRFTEICHVDDGKVTERWAFFEDPSALESTMNEFAG